MRLFFLRFLRHHTLFKMRGLAHVLATKHTALARVVLPAAIVSGFAYTVAYGTNPIDDARAWATGEFAGCDGCWGLAAATCAPPAPSVAPVETTGRACACIERCRGVGGGVGEGGGRLSRRGDKDGSSPKNNPLNQLFFSFFPPGDARPAPRITAVQFAPGRR